MKPYSFTICALTLGLVAACSSSSDDRGPSLGSGGDEPTAGAAGSPSGGGAGSVRAGSGGVAGAGEGGAATAGDAGALNEGGAGGLEPGVVIDVTPSVCLEAADWGAAAQLAGVSSNAAERLLSITPDELDVVFVRGSNVLRAHRDTVTEAFTGPKTVTLPAGYDVAEGAALSADAKTLVIVASTRRAFAALTRANRTAAFGATAETAAFNELNLRSVQTMENYTAPVLAPDGKTFVFTGFTPEPEAGFPVGFKGISVVYEASLGSNGWTAPVNISDGLFEGTSAERPLPTGLSSDSRTLFYFDESTDKQGARFRDRPDAPLYTLVDLGNRPGASPNSACDVIYYSLSGNVLFDSD